MSKCMKKSQKRGRHEELDLPEESLRMLESRIGMRITIIDNDGIFNCKQRRRVFSEERASHKKNPVCLCGFSEKCIAHCRYAMNRKCLESDSAFFLLLLERNLPDCGSADLCLGALRDALRGNVSFFRTNSA